MASPEVVIICPKLTGYNPIAPPRSLRGWVKKNYAKISLCLGEIFVKYVSFDEDRITVELMRDESRAEAEKEV